MQLEACLPPFPWNRFFEYKVSWVDVQYHAVDEVSNTSYLENVTELVVVPTHLRQDVIYIQVGAPVC